MKGKKPAHKHQQQKSGEENKKKCAQNETTIEWNHLAGYIESKA